MRRWLPVPVIDLSPEGKLHPRWLGEPACRGFAWLDLVAQAAWEDTDDLRRGEVQVSVRFLAQRWGWSKSRVQRFLERLENHESISRAGHGRAHKAGRVPGRIMINAYDIYTTRGDTKRDTRRDTSEDKVVEVRSSVETPFTAEREIFAAFVAERKRHVPNALDLKPTDTRLKRIRARLAEGLTSDQAVEVARGIFYADNHVRDGWKNSTIDVAFRSMENCQRFICAFGQVGTSELDAVERTQAELYALRNGSPE